MNTTKSKNINFRVNEKERKTLKVFARRKGVTISDYIRSNCLPKEKQESTKLSEFEKNCLSYDLADINL